MRKNDERLSLNLEKAKDTILKDLGGDPEEFGQVVIPSKIRPGTFGVVTRHLLGVSWAHVLTPNENGFDVHKVAVKAEQTKKEQEDEAWKRDL